jgi:hypothetical protein
MFLNLGSQGAVPAGDLILLDILGHIGTSVPV